MILPVLLLTGCWDLTEPEDISLVSVMGISMNDENQYEIICLDQTLVAGGQEYQKSNWTFDIHKSTGTTIYDAMQNNLKINPEKIYLSHTKVLIVSEELVSKQGLRSVIDFFDRNPEMRHNTLFLISKKGEFEKVFLPNAKLNIDTGKIIDKLIKNGSVNSLVVNSKLKDLLELYWGEYTTPYALGVGTSQTLVNGRNINQGYDNVNVDTYDINIGDIAVFKNGKMVGWLTGEESRGFLWVKGKVEGGEVNVKYQGKLISLKILYMKSAVKPVVEKQGVKIDLNIHVEADIGESMADMDFADHNTILQVQQLLNEQITLEINKAILASKNLSSDVFGFGNAVFEDYPNYWKTIAGKWMNDYPGLDVNIQVDSNIQHIGLTKKSDKTVK